MSAPLHSTRRRTQSPAAASDGLSTSCVSPSVGETAFFMPKSEKRALNALLAEITEQRTLLEARQLEAKAQRAVVKRLAKTVESELKRLSDRATDHRGLQGEHTHFQSSNNAGSSSLSNRYWSSKRAAPLNNSHNEGGEVCRDRAQDSSSRGVTVAWSTKSDDASSPASTTEKSINCSSCSNDVDSSAPYYYSSLRLGYITSLQSASSRTAGTAAPTVTQKDNGSTTAKTQCAPQRIESPSNRVATPTTASTAVPYTPPSRNSLRPARTNASNRGGSSEFFTGTPFNTEPQGRSTWAGSSASGASARAAMPYNNICATTTTPPRTAKVLKMLTGVPSQVLPPIKQYLYCPTAIAYEDEHVPADKVSSGGTATVTGSAVRLVGSNSGPLGSPANAITTQHHDAASGNMFEMRDRHNTVATAGRAFVDDIPKYFYDSVEGSALQCTIPNASCTVCGSSLVTFRNGGSRTVLPVGHFDKTPQAPRWPATAGVDRDPISHVSRGRCSPAFASSPPHPLHTLSTKTTTAAAKSAGTKFSVEPPTCTATKEVPTPERPLSHLQKPVIRSSAKSSLKTSNAERTGRLKDSQLPICGDSKDVGSSCVGMRTQSMRALRDLGCDPLPCRRLPLAKAVRVESCTGASNDTMACTATIAHAHQQRLLVCDVHLPSKSEFDLLHCTVDVNAKRGEQLQYNLSNSNITSRRSHITKDGVLVAHIGSELPSIVTSTPVIQSESSSAHRSPTTHTIVDSTPRVVHGMLMSHSTLHDANCSSAYSYPRPKSNFDFTHRKEDSVSAAEDSNSLRIDMWDGGGDIDAVPCGSCRCCHHTAADAKRFTSRHLRKRRQRRRRRIDVIAAAMPPHYEDSSEEYSSRSSSCPVDVCVVVNSGSVVLNHTAAVSNLNNHNFHPQHNSWLRGSSSEVFVPQNFSSKKTVSKCVLPQSPVSLNRSYGNCLASQTAPPATSSGTLIANVGSAVCVHPVSDDLLYDSSAVCSPSTLKEEGCGGVPLRLSSTSLPDGFHDWSTVDVTPANRDDEQRMLSPGSHRRHYYSRYKRYSPRSISRLYTTTSSSSTTTVTNRALATKISNIVDSTTSEHDLSSAVMGVTDYAHCLLRSNQDAAACDAAACGGAANGDAANGGAANGDAANGGAACGGAACGGGNGVTSPLKLRNSTEIAVRPNQGSSQGGSCAKYVMRDRYTSVDSRNSFCAHESEILGMETQSEPATCLCNT
eukprot:Lankesteria_metandrocarpae@DN872_c0_g1_i1.p1